MIQVTRLNDKNMVINCEKIESIEANPDTIITMTTGKKLIVRDSIDEIIDKTIEYKQEINKRWEEK